MFVGYDTIAFNLNYRTIIMNKALFLLLITVFIIPFGCKKADTDPVASFSVSNRNPTIGEFVTFTNTSQNAHHIKWTFPDGTNASSNSVSYTFNFNGIFNVRLDAYDKNETYSDFATEDISVCTPGSVVFYTDSASYKSPITISLNGAFVGALSNPFDGIPNCGSPGAVTAEICPGTYSYYAVSAENKVWQNMVKVTANGCVAIKLN
jgi:PKD repeat protein